MNKPTIFKMNDAGDMRRFRLLLARDNSIDVKDDIGEELKELFQVRDPSRHVDIASVPEKFFRSGCIVYLPWLKTAVKILSPKLFEEVRLSRNKILITPEEQNKLAKARIGIAGLNVGNPAAVCMALEGMRRFIFADNDSLSLSNLNRFRANLGELGINKAELSARQVYEINPFADIVVWNNGVVEKDIKKFLLRPRLRVLIEETDSLLLKIRLREAAKRARIPVIMVTGNSENVILDVERFDYDHRLPLLNGYLKEEIIECVTSGKFVTLPQSERLRVMRDFVGGNDLLTKRLRNSFKLAGTKLAGIPQLAECSFLRGSVLTNAVRKIILGYKLKSGRYHFCFDNLSWARV